MGFPTDVACEAADAATEAGARILVSLSFGLRPRRNWRVSVRMISFRARREGRHKRNFFMEL